MSETKSAPQTPPDERTWPPLLKTSDAARYCGYESVFGLLKACERGRVFPAGRRGGKGTYMWRREDLDRFLRGEPPTNVPPGYEPARIGRPPRPSPRPFDRKALSEMLARVQALKAERRGS